MLLVVLIGLSIPPQGFFVFIRYDDLLPFPSDSFVFLLIKCRSPRPEQWQANTLHDIYILLQKAFIVNIICRFTHNKLLDHIEFTTVLLIDTTDAGGDQVNFTGVRQVSIP